MEQVATVLRNAAAPKSNQSDNTYDHDSPLREQPPLVRPKKMPDQIMREHMMTDDIAAITHILRLYRNSHIGWDEYRAKIRNDAQDLLDAWLVVLNECWKNGFMGPEVIGGKIRWRQVLGSHNKLSDGCTMCRDECPVLSESHNRQMFRPCWKRPERSTP